MKALVTGAKGLLGREVCAELRTRSWNVVAVDLDEADICDLDAAVKLVRDIGPEAVVHCAAYTAVDACESDPEGAFRVNTLGARNIALGARQAGTKILYLSTDYVFSGGKEGAYSEFDAVGPLSVYGASKEAGERAVREQTPNHFILRTAWLYGDDEKCFPATIIRLARQFAAEGKPLRVVHDQRGSPTWSRELARQIARVLPTQAFGTYHVTARGETTWYQFARRIVKDLGISVAVEPCTTEEFPRPAPRPVNSVLDNFCLRLQGLDVMLSWEEAWAEFVKTRI